MNRLCLAGLLVLVPGAIWADSITGSGGYTTFPSPIPTEGTGVYWDNASLDGSAMNIGDFLTGSGGFSGGTNYNPSQYYAQSAGSTSAPASFGFISEAPSVDITLLGGLATKNGSGNAYSGDFGTEFGYYDPTAQDAASSEVAVYASGAIPGAIGTTTNVVMPYSTYGLYVTVCTATVQVGNSWTCASTNTYFSDSALNSPSDPDHQHFALFNLAEDANTYFVGVEDSLNNSGEGYGDFNDLILEFKNEPDGGGGGGLSITPEPATFELMGAALVGLVFLRRRARPL